MNILVCVKQVPAGLATMDAEKGILIRSSVGATINPSDLVALEMAIRIKEKHQAHITALCMGPLSAKESLRKALAMGADKAILLSDSAFAGSDVYMTAFTLSQLIKTMTFDLIICGQNSTDGDTGQFPFSLAAQLDLVSVGFVKHIENIQKNKISLVQEVSQGMQKVTCEIPFLVSFAQEACMPRIPSLSQRLEANKAYIEHKALKDLPCTNSDSYGLKSSPTQVKGIFSPPNLGKSSCFFLSGEECALQIKEELQCQ